MKINTSYHYFALEGDWVIVGCSFLGHSPSSVLDGLLSLKNCSFYYHLPFLDYFGAITSVVDQRTWNLVSVLGILPLVATTVNMLFADNG